MALKSMTGFGRGEMCGEAVKVVVELSSVNRKQFDCSVSLPRELASLDSKVQSAVRVRVARGYVKGLVTVTGVEELGDAHSLNLTRLAAQLNEVRRAAQALGLADDLTASDLLRLPDLLRPHVLPDDPLEVWPLVEQALQIALDNLEGMRLSEGAALERDLRGRFAALRGLDREIAELAPGVPMAYKAVLERRLVELLAPGQVSDADLIAREVAVFADRCDVSEELTRLASHFAQVDKVCDAGGSCGRTLDFLCQELFREINTTGSKANDAAISRLVIDFKAGLEAVREQVQNIE